MLDYLFYFFAGAFLANSIPHLTNGISGRAFPTPFARPRGQGESSASLNVIWGAFNFGVGYTLLFFCRQFQVLCAHACRSCRSGGFAHGLVSGLAS